MPNQPMRKRWSSYRTSSSSLCTWHFKRIKKKSTSNLPNVNPPFFVPLYPIFDLYWKKKLWLSMIDLSFSSYFAFSLCLICSLFKESLLKGPSSNLFSTPPLQLTIINFEISKTREKKGHHCRDTQCTSFRMLKKLIWFLT